MVPPRPHARLDKISASYTPTVQYEELTYTVTLFRPDKMGVMKKEEIIFGEHRLSVCACRENELNSSERSQIKSAPDAEGLIYYLHARPYDVGAAYLIGLKDKEEALAMRKALREAEDEDEDEDASEDEGDKPCSFCGNKGCEGDHGDDMRDWQREVLQRD